MSQNARCVSGQIVESACAHWLDHTDARQARHQGSAPALAKRDALSHGTWHLQYPNQERQALRDPALVRLPVGQIRTLSSKTGSMDSLSTTASRSPPPRTVKLNLPSLTTLVTPPRPITNIYENMAVGTRSRSVKTLARPSSDASFPSSPRQSYSHRTSLSPYRPISRPSAKRMRGSRS